MERTVTSDVEGPSSERCSTSGETEPVRIWCLVCSTSEEAYTIAAQRHRIRTQNEIARDLRLYSADVNSEALQTAELGRCPDKVCAELPAGCSEPLCYDVLLDTISISALICARVIFKAHIATDDPAGTKTNLIVCRNLLIHLSSDVMTKEVARLRRELHKRGYLLLGVAEMPDKHGVVFQAVVRGARMYRNTRTVDLESARPKNVLVYRPPHVASSARHDELKSVA